MTITAQALQAGTVNNTPTVTGTEFDGNTANNSAPVSTLVTSGADIQVATTASPSPVLAGTNVTYTIAVTNLGPENGVDDDHHRHLARVLDVHFLSLTGGGVCGGTGNARSVGFSAPTPSGGSATITIVARVNAGTADGTSSRTRHSR